MFIAVSSRQSSRAGSTLTLNASTGSNSSLDHLPKSINTGNTGSNNNINSIVGNNRGTNSSTSLASGRTIIGNTEQHQSSSSTHNGAKDIDIPDSLQKDSEHQGGSNKKSLSKSEWLAKFSAYLPADPPVSKFVPSSSPSSIHPASTSSSSMHSSLTPSTTTSSSRFRSNPTLTLTVVSSTTTSTSTLSVASPSPPVIRGLTSSIPDYQMTVPTSVLFSLLSTAASSLTQKDASIYSTPSPSFTSTPSREFTQPVLPKSIASVTSLSKETSESKLQSSSYPVSVSGIDNSRKSILFKCPNTTSTTPIFHDRLLQSSVPSLAFSQTQHDRTSLNVTEPELTTSIKISSARKNSSFTTSSVTVG